LERQIFFSEDWMSEGGLVGYSENFGLGRKDLFKNDDFF
jgi:hypothetical protein